MTTDVQPVAGVRSSWARTFVFATAAATVATALMFLVRSLFEIRTLPERVMEWALLFVSPTTFEAGIGQFGAQAKVYALYASVAGTTLLLLLLGVLLLRNSRSPLLIAASGPALYLVALALVMPVTGGGLFGSLLPQDRWLVNACYLAIGLAYSSVLLLGRVWGAPRVAGAPAAGATSVRTGQTGPLSVAAPGVPANRRVLLASMVATLVSTVFAGWRGQRGGGAGADLPLARLDSLPARSPAAASPVVASPPALGTVPPSVAQDATAPASVTTTASPTTAALAPPPTSAPTSQPAPVAAAPSPTPGLPVPAAETYSKQVERGEDGALTAGGREPGTLSELITPTERFYQVTKNAVSDPMIQPDRWRLAIDGDVQSPVQLDYATLLQVPTVEIVKTLECISNFTAQCELPPFGCELISTARWRGIRLSDVIALAGGAKAGVTQVSLIASDEFTSTIPLEVALDPDTILAYEMNGQPLPYAHGYPARVLSSGRYGYKSAKWITGVRLATAPILDWYGQRNWNKDGIVKTMSRIDLPAPSATLPAGSQRIAGIAYAGDRGVAAVEISTDDGQSWQPTTFLEPSPGKDAWVRWETIIALSSGLPTRVFSRAMDGTGQYQTSEFVLPAPDGASGLNSIQITGS